MVLNECSGRALITNAGDSSSVHFESGVGGVGGSKKFYPGSQRNSKGVAEVKSRMRASLTRRSVHSVNS